MTSSDWKEGVTMSTLDDILNDMFVLPKRILPERAAVQSVNTINALNSDKETQ